MPYIIPTIIENPTEPTVQQVIQQYHHLIYGIALTGTSGNYQDAEDVLQETFLAYFRTKKQFQDESYRKAWLIRTALNYCKKITGSSYRKRTVSLEDVHTSLLQFDLPEENMIFSALCNLRPMYRNVLYLHYFAGYQTDEIAKLLRKRAGTIRMQLMRGREQLRAALSKEGFCYAKTMQTNV